jgi:hypothetical protein
MANFGHFFENYGSSPNLWATLSHGKSSVLILAKFVWATFWASFFTNSSGHPAHYYGQNPWD